MTFDSYMLALERKTPLTGDIKMTPAQFRNMQKQAYDKGFSQGKDVTARFLKQQKIDNPFGNLF